MKKMIKHYRGRASLKEGTLKNSRAWRRLTRKESGAALRRVESPDGEGELTRDQQFTISQRKGVKGTEPPGLTKRRGSSVDVEEGHRGG